MKKPTRVGIFGGTFDPVHNGHLIMAQVARERWNLNRVIFMPAGQPWLKADRNISSADERLEMVRLAIQGTRYFEVSEMEVERGGLTYTVDTLDDMRAEWGKGIEIYLILGVDAILSLPEWKEPLRLMKECWFVVLPRSGRRVRDMEVLESKLPGVSDRLLELDVPEIGISSTWIRERVALGLPIKYWVPQAVDAYIRKHGLYKL